MPLKCRPRLYTSWLPWDVLTFYRIGCRLVQFWALNQNPVAPYGNTHRRNHSDTLRTGWQWHNQRTPKSQHHPLPALHFGSLTVCWLPKWTARVEIGYRLSSSSSSSSTNVCVCCMDINFNSPRTKWAKYSSCVLKWPAMSNTMTKKNHIVPQRECMQNQAFTIAQAAVSWGWQAALGCCWMRCIAAR